MIVDFSLLDDSSRVWIFQSDEIISDDKIDLINFNLNSFLTNWSSHGKELKCSYEIKFNLFIVIGVDSPFNNASGCSIDTLTNFIFDLQSKTNLNFFNRLAIAFKSNDKINIKSMSEIKEMIKNEEFLTDTIVYNNLVKTKKEYINAWESLAIESWHKNLFI
ncbi:MAG: ABC transporter ATPase [Bacteroidota bacterium]|nr:ABC transporter ATPase [Bacteroidota bacterium]